MPYQVPQVLVFQEFNLIPTEITAPLRAHISGPHAYLLRHDEPGEKGQGDLGAYDPDNDKSYLWPHRPVGALVDPSFTKVFIEGARLEYYADPLGAPFVAPVAGTKNQVRAADATGAFKASGAADRYAALLDRDVRVGDHVRVSGTVAAVTHTRDTYVKAIRSTGVTDRVGATIDATPDAQPGNGPTQVASAVVVPPTPPSTTTLSATTTDYDAYADGVLIEVYTVEVVVAQAGDNISSAKLKITSASGLDDALSVTPGNTTVAFDVGHRGLKLTFTGTQPLTLGQTWTVTINDNYTAIVPTAGGAYAGTKDTTYIVTCTRGGVFDGATEHDKPALTVTTTHGIDVSGPFTLTGEAPLAAPVTIPAGTKGVTFTIPASAAVGIRKGDTWYIKVTAEADGAFRTLELGHNLPDALLLPTPVTDLELRLAIVQDLLEVTEQRVGFEPLVNWTQSATELTLKADIIAYDPSWAANGVPQPLTVGAGKVFVEYRGWRSELTTGVGSVSDVGELDDAIPGPLDPSNPLKWGVYKALSNSNGTAVKFTAVADPASVSSWNRVVELLVGRDDVYNLVPLTFDREVQNLFAAHVDAESAPNKGRWRACFVSLEAIAEAVVVSAATSADQEEVLGIIIDDPNTSNTQYTVIEVPANNANFLTNEVAPGDIVRINYSVAGGQEVYEEYVIDAVPSEDSLRLVSGPAVGSIIARKLEVWHNLSKDEVADDIADRAGSFSSRRVKVVWPDEIGSAGTTMPGYYVAAALGGLRSGVVPHQGLTNVEIAGFDDAPRTNTFFNATQLDHMAESGVWVVTQVEDGTILTRHALTTDTLDLNRQEEMVVTNIDSMSYLFLRRMRPFIGSTNVTPTTLSRLRIELVSAIEFLKSNGFTPTLGSQLIDGNVVRLAIHETNKDRVVAVLELTIPYPLNVLEIHLVV